MVVGRASSVMSSGCTLGFFLNVSTQGTGRENTSCLQPIICSRSIMVVMAGKEDIFTHRKPWESACTQSEVGPGGMGALLWTCP